MSIYQVELLAFIAWGPALGCSRGGLTTKTHLCMRRPPGRPLAFALTGGQVADTVMLPTTMEQVRVPTAGRPRT
jgi:hypothetical protein